MLTGWLSEALLLNPFGMIMEVAAAFAGIRNHYWYFAISKRLLTSAEAFNFAQ